MSKKKKSIMDGYFDEPATVVEINPFVEEILVSKTNLDVFNKIEKTARFPDTPTSPSTATEGVSDFGFHHDDNYSLLGTLTQKIKSEEVTTFNTKPVEKQSTIGLQLDHKQSTDKSTDKSTIGLQLDHKQSTEKVSDSELVYKRYAEQSTDKSTIGLQLDHKQSTKWCFSSLSGHERNFVIFVFQNCKNSGSLTSSPISNIQLREYLKTPSSSTVKTVVDRVIQKGLISKKPGKKGRGGWMLFEIEKGVFQDLLLGETDYKRSTISLQKDHIRYAEQTTEQTTIPSYSSSSNLNINTNTTGDASLSMPENLNRFGISVINLQNLVSSGKATKEIVERSLAALSFDVDYGKTGNLANILFGVLRSGKEYVSQKQAEQLSKELEFELNRIKEIEATHQKLTETRLKTRYKEFLEKTPNYLAEVKKRHNGLLNDNSDLLEKIAFEEFKQS